MAGAVAVKNMAQYSKATVISEVAMMPLAVEKVNFFTLCLSIKHPIFSEMVSWALPFKNIAE